MQSATYQSVPKSSMSSELIAALAGLALTLSGSCLSAAQTYPSKPVHVIVSVTAASVSDIAVRKIGEEVKNLTGQPWLVENRPGGNFFWRPKRAFAPRLMGIRSALQTADHFHTTHTSLRKSHMTSTRI
jgi:hypothetical protein